MKNYQGLANELVHSMTSAQKKTLATILTKYSNKDYRPQLLLEVCLLYKDDPQFVQACLEIEDEKTAPKWLKIINGCIEELQNKKLI